MDPIVQAIKTKRNELQAELKRLDKTLEAYGESKPVPAASGIIEGLDAVVEQHLRSFDTLTGYTANEIAKAIHQPQASGSVLKVLRSNKQFKCVTPNQKRWQRFRLAENVKPPEPELQKVEKVRKLKPSVRKAKSSVRTDPAKNRKTIRDLFKSRRWWTVPDLCKETGINSTTVRRHVMDLVEAEAVKDVGLDPNWKWSKDQTKQPYLFESRIYEAPRETKIHVGSTGVSTTQGRIIQ